MNTIKSWLMYRHVKKFGSKNNGYFNYFVINWSEYKDFVLYLVNHKNYFVRMFGRHKFRINQDREAKGKLIKDIFPNHYDIENPDGSITSVFRTHQKYAKRLYYGFYPVWWTLHLLDWLIQRTVAPEFSFGFDTLTVYPDADPETSTWDGAVIRHNQNESLSSILSGAGTGFLPSATDNALSLVATTTTSQYARNSRFIALFDTSALTADAIISATTFSVYPISRLAGNGQLGYHIVSSTPGSNTGGANSDYGQLGTTSFGTMTYAELNPTSAYVEESLNSSGVAHISKTSITKLGMRFGFDSMGDSNPTWSSGATSRVTIYNADQTGTDNDPKLTITYTINIIINQRTLV